MNVDFVNPFLESIINVLATMANTEAKPDKPFLKSKKIAKGDVSIIGLTGEKSGEDQRIRILYATSFYHKATFLRS